MPIFQNFYADMAADGRLTEAQRNQLIENFKTNNFRRNADEDADEIDFRPVVRLYCPLSSAIWLLTEYDPEDDLLFGLCDLGMGFPELGFVSLSEMRETHKTTAPILNDSSFAPTLTLSAYAEEARRLGHIAY